jgi:ABC-type multidrug transport system fused ATPase/permease subunit
MATDGRIQAVMRKDFERSTVITIAHRLHTVVDYDRIVVMDNGRAVEVGAPSDLLDKEGGFLWKMAAALGPQAQGELRALAGAGRDRPAEQEEGKRD